MASLAVSAAAVLGEPALSAAALGTAALCTVALGAAVSSAAAPGAAALGAAVFGADRVQREVLVLDAETHPLAAVQPYHVIHQDILLALLSCGDPG